MGMHADMGTVEQTGQGNRTWGTVHLFACVRFSGHGDGSSVHICPSFTKN